MMVSPQSAPQRSAWDLYPAIDILGGSCVRLSQGNFDRADEYNEDPIDQALAFARLGARCLHIVDLDGARSGSSPNRELIVEIIRSCPGVFVQVGGGIRDDEALASYLEAGVDAAIIGTASVTNPEWVAEAAKRHPGRVRISLDAKDGKLALSGWQESSEVMAIDAARRFSFPEVSALIYTDINKDGLLTGVNIEATLALAESQDIPVIASGGVAGMEDVRRLYEARHHNLAGVILGRALYTGALDLREAISSCGWD